MITPYVSFVAVARNDNYGGDFLTRINLFVKSVVVLAERYALPAEVLIVEWNPPADRPRLKDAVSWPARRREHCLIKIVEVAPALHGKLPNPQDLCLFEYIGKNVGIRRASGQFVLVTNPDIIFSEKIMRFLSAQQLSADHFYRAGRTDVRGPIPAEETLEEQLQFCKNHVLTYIRHGFSCRSGIRHRFNPYKRARACASYIKQSLKFYPFQYPFTEASGDFMLMHRDRWHALRGYAEFPNRGHHLDTIMVLNALFDGVKQVVMSNSLSIYHQEHGRPESDKPWAQDAASAYEQLMRERRALQINAESWGFGAHELIEDAVTGCEAERPLSRVGT